MVLGALSLPLETDLRASSISGRQNISAAGARRIARWLQQRIERREPLAYLGGTAWLMGRAFLADRRALIPRSLIASLLNDARFCQSLMRRLQPESARAQPTKGAPLHILDLCCGSASLAVLAGTAFPDAKIVASDLSRAALQLAARNCALHKMRSRIRLVCADGWPGRGRCDLVLCNPPYVTEAAMRALPEEFRHEPRLALAAGQDGMDWIARALPLAAAHLSERGIMLLEVGHNRQHFERRFAGLKARWPTLPNSAGGAVALLTARALRSFSER